MSTKVHQKKQNGRKKKIEKKTHSYNSVLVKIKILGVNITNETTKNILEFIAESIEKTKKNYFIVTPNPEMVTFAYSHPRFRYILNTAEIALCDGVGLFAAGKIIGKPLKERITGTDMMEKLCEMVSNRPITVGFLGGRGKVAEKTAECLKRKYPNLQVGFAASEWEDLKQKVPVDILFVAFGFPKQEEWMAEHINKVPVRIMMGVGGAFDYISGNVKRAPVIVQYVGLEWLYRLRSQPWRWRRQLSLLQFMMLIMLQSIRII